MYKLKAAIKDLKLIREYINEARLNIDNSDELLDILSNIDDLANHANSAVAGLKSDSKNYYLLCKKISYR